jgi:nucleotide-binding universal stress UspA family protein
VLDARLAHATALARWYDAHLEVLHVVPALEEAGSPVSAADAEPPRWSRGQLIGQIERTLAAAGATGLQTRALVREGRAHEVITYRARTLPADLLVLGTHGRSGVTRLLLGSVTEKVIRQVACPVLTVPPAAPEGAADGLVAFKKILCPIDYSPSASKALQYALNLAHQAGGCVTALHALEYMDQRGVPRTIGVRPV